MMAKWLQTLDISEAWQATSDDDTKLPELVADVIAKLKALRPYKEEYIENGRQQVIDEFEMFDPGDDLDGFDAVMSELYDWADQSTIGGKVCWVKTF
ncbi:hypothetical protein PHIN3_3 [Sinorhizobium phage phiN3]|uniref:Uncharacterized protein n=1 Tax=Sinorhizobium phage phiN3 TaxID=1647405 RepID=A0A0F6WCH7_9CAUD|nr:hypothetical protein AVT40_gp003 [Sinorhizobium phage phiN3]AKF13270.1 hypothetical protein PHIN3_3 [Sinorhizobium phage phiN3]